MASSLRCPACGGSVTTVAEGQIPKRMGGVIVFDHVPFLSCNACENIFTGAWLKPALQRLETSK
jgi:uncharacterized protein with PIN domain